MSSKTFGETIKDEIKLADDHIKDDFVSDTRISMLVGSVKKSSSWRNWKKHTRKLRKRKNKVERIKTRMIRKLSSPLYPFKRTH